MKRGLMFADWLIEHPPPTVMDLIERFGGYDAIPDEAWAQHEKDIEEWCSRVRDRDRE